MENQLYPFCANTKYLLLNNLDYLQEQIKHLPPNYSVWTAKYSMFRTLSSWKHSILSFSSPSQKLWVSSMHFKNRKETVIKSKDCISNCRTWLFLQDHDQIIYWGKLFVLGSWGVGVFCLLVLFGGLGVLVLIVLEGCLIFVLFWGFVCLFKLLVIYTQNQNYNCRNSTFN